MVKYEIINKILTKKEIGKLIDTVYRHAGQKATVIFADKMMSLGLERPVMRVFHLVRTIWLYLKLNIP